MLKVRGCQSTSPEMRACSAPPIKNRNVSLLASEETFHQKLTVAGPATMVCMELEALLPMAPLCAASTPSWVMFVWHSHGALASVVQVKAGVSRDSANVQSPTNLTVAFEE